MGHAIFIILHILAILFAIPLLVLTVPLHLIYGVLAGRKKETGEAGDTPSAKDIDRQIEARMRAERARQAKVKQRSL